ncbi:rho GTPase-activating protein 15 isoform X2 [Cynoglossus semilaevis]|uniref:Rho GTPase-activating protein 15 n=1 Tax=Cynoglossus semilaevis TaxID=244447 RepID=A0A3P8WDD1_CYNSE|nr:rho GTPase-activating protein 15 isoform X2 [Cynoglossus semilaevis]
MASKRISNMQNKLGQDPPVTSVQLRTKTSQSCGERLTQSRSMVLQESDFTHKLNLSVGGASAAAAKVRGEVLNVAKIKHHGQKQKKVWTGMCLVLDSDQLYFYTEPSLEQSDVVQLSGAVVQWVKDKSSRENVFQVTTRTGSEFLLQLDTRPTASKWFHAIEDAVQSSTRSNLHLRRSNSSENLHRHRPPTGQGTTANTKKTTPVHRRSIIFRGSKLKHTSSDLDKTGVKNKLKKFLSRRPSMKTLQEKGLIKDRVYGCDLFTLCQREGTCVPSFVQQCVNAIDKRGLEVHGIYRVSGNLATIQKLRFIVDQEEKLDLDQPQWSEIHVVTGALKMFFRELPEPLFPLHFFQSVVDVLNIKDAKEKVQRLKKLIDDLPRVNYETVKLLFLHLNRVLKFSRQNLMSTQSLGIVFGPTLMWAGLEAGNMAVNMVYQSQIVELVLIQSPGIFSLDRK